MDIYWIEDVLIDLAQCAANERADDLKNALLVAAAVARKGGPQPTDKMIESANKDLPTAFKERSNVIYPEIYKPRQLKTLLK